MRISGFIAIILIGVAVWWFYFRKKQDEQEKRIYAPDKDVKVAPNSYNPNDLANQLHFAINGVNVGDQLLSIVSFGNATDAKAVETMRENTFKQLIGLPDSSMIAVYNAYNQKFKAGTDTLTRQIDKIFALPFTDLSGLKSKLVVKLRSLNLK